MNEFLDGLIREIEYECYHTSINKDADRDADTDDEMPGLIDEEDMPGLIDDDDGYNENSHLMNIYGDFHSYKEYEYDCEETLPDVASELEEGVEEAKEELVEEAKEELVEEAKEELVLEQAKEDVVIQAKEELVLEEATKFKELKEDIMNSNSQKDVVIEIKELESVLEPALEPPMDREIKQPTRSFCIIC